jgi:hypothetical protein
MWRLICTLSENASPLELFAFCMFPLHPSSLMSSPRVFHPLFLWIFDPA